MHVCRASKGRALANVLELAKRAVDLERLGELLHSSKVSVKLAIIVRVVATNGVVPEAATESRIDASKAADTCQIEKV